MWSDFAVSVGTGEQTGRIPVVCATVGRVSISPPSSGFNVLCLSFASTASVADTHLWAILLVAAELIHRACVRVGRATLMLWKLS